MCCLRLVMDFLPRNKCLLISWLQSPSPVILEPKKIKSVTLFTFSPIFAMKWWDWCHDLSFLNAEFQASFFTLLFSSYSVSASRVVSSAYLRLLVSLSAILIPVCDSSSLLFHMMYSACKLNKQGDNIHPCPSFESVSCSMFSSSCCFLTHIQVSQEISNVVLYSHLFKNFPQFVVMHTIKGLTMCLYYYIIHIS